MKSAAHDIDKNTRLWGGGLSLDLLFGIPYSNVSDYPSTMATDSMNIHQSSTSDGCSKGILAPLNRIA